MNVNMSWRRASRALAMSAVLVLSMAAVDGAPPRYFKMKSVQVIDKGGFAKPTPAMDVLVPSDWTFEGGVQWANRGCFADLAAVTFKTTSPDGKIVIEAFPSFSWQAVDNPSVQRYLIAENQEGLKVGLKPCPVFGPVPAADVLRKRVIPQLRPGKEIAAMDTSADLDRSRRAWPRSRRSNRNPASPCRFAPMPRVRDSSTISTARPSRNGSSGSAWRRHRPPATDMAAIVWTAARSC